MPCDVAAVHRHEVDPNLLMNRELQLECRYAPGVIGMPQTFNVLLEPTG